MNGPIAIASTPGCWFATATLVDGHPALASSFERERFMVLLERIRATFLARVYAYGVTSACVRLVVAPRDHREEPEVSLRDRWRRLTPRSVPPTERLRARLGSLSGLMQTVLQRFTRDWNQRHARLGSMWAGHYRSTLLVDDRALLAALSWVEASSEVCSRGHHEQPRPLVSLAPPPLRIGPGEFLCPADEAPPGCVPPSAGTVDDCLARFSAAIPQPSTEAHGRALASGWALGRPESLGGVISRLGRGRGRGRIRQMRDLDDELGLYGVWG